MSDTEMRGPREESKSKARRIVPPAEVNLIAFETRFNKGSAPSSPARTVLIRVPSDNARFY